MEQESRGADRRGGPEVNDCCEFCVHSTDFILFIVLVLI